MGLIQSSQFFVQINDNELTLNVYLNKHYKVFKVRSGIDVFFDSFAQQNADYSDALMKLKNENYPLDVFDENLEIFNKFTLPHDLGEQY